MHLLVFCNSASSLLLNLTEFPDIYPKVLQLDKHSIGRRLDTLHRRFNKIDKSQPLEDKNLQKMVTILIEIDTLKPKYKKNYLLNLGKKL